MASVDARDRRECPGPPASGGTAASAAGEAGNKFKFVYLKFVGGISFYFDFLFFHLSE